MIDAAWIDRFDGLSNLPPSVRETLSDRGVIAKYPRGTVLFAPGKDALNMLLLLSGTVRVQQSSDTGREIILFRVEAGESCVLTSACLLGQQDYTAEGVAESDVQAVAIPRGVFDALVSTSREFRDFVFQAYARRFTDLFRVIDEVAFGRIDVRLAERLIALARDTNEVHATHQQLASELGTAREVISRQLTDFHKRGWIDQARGRVHLIDRGALDQIANA